MELLSVIEDYILENSNGIILDWMYLVQLSTRLDLLVNEFVYKLLTDKYITIFEKHLS